MNQLFIWEMFGWAPLTLSTCGEKESCHPVRRATFAALQAAFERFPWKTEAVGSFWNFGTPGFSHSKWLNLFGRHWLERQLWFGFPFCELASQQFQKRKPCSVSFSWNMGEIEAPFKSMQNCWVVCLTFNRIFRAILVYYRDLSTSAHHLYILRPCWQNFEGQGRILVLVRWGRLLVYFLFPSTFHPGPIDFSSPTTSTLPSWTSMFVFPLFCLPLASSLFTRTIELLNSYCVRTF